MSKSQIKVNIVIPPLHWRGVYCFTSVRPSICPSVLPSVRPSFRLSQDIFRHIFLSNYWWQKSDIWVQASYRYPISWEVFLDPSDSYFLFADLAGFYTHWTYMWGYHKWALAHSSSCCNYIYILGARRFHPIIDVVSHYFCYTTNWYFNRYKLSFLSTVWQSTPLYVCTSVKVCKKLDNSV